LGHAAWGKIVAEIEVPDGHRSTNYCRKQTYRTIEMVVVLKKLKYPAAANLMVVDHQTIVE
jgi:hypothetical protein